MPDSIDKLRPDRDLQCFYYDQSVLKSWLMVTWLEGLKDENGMLKLFSQSWSINLGGCLRRDSVDLGHKLWQRPGWIPASNWVRKSCFRGKVMPAA